MMEEKANWHPAMKKEKGKRKNSGVSKKGTPPETERDEGGRGRGSRREEERRGRREEDRWMGGWIMTKATWVSRSRSVDRRERMEETGDGGGELKGRGKGRERKERGREVK